VDLSVLEGEELFFGTGNDSADRYAEAARKFHPQPSAELAASIDKLLYTVKTVLDFMAALLPLWSFGGCAHTRVASEKKEGDVGVILKVKAEELHEWELQGTHWCCRICRARTLTSVLTKNPKTQRMQGTVGPPGQGLGSYHLAIS